MKFNRVFTLIFATLVLAVSVRADLASLFTNVTPLTVANETRPSIVYIQCHGLARGDLSCYGQTNYQTPNLDRLAAEGIRFTQYTGGADSAATTAQLLGAQPNIAQRLQQTGYHTGLIGEWGQGGQPWLNGFDEFVGFLEDAEGTNYYSDFLWRYAPKSIFNETNNTMDTFVGRVTVYGNEGGKKKRYLPELFINAMNNFIRVNQPDVANQYRPFFLMVNLPAPRTATAGADDFPVPTDAPFTGERWPQAAKNRAALMTRLDAGIGRLFEQLDKLKLTNQTTIFFTASSPPEKFTDKSLNFLLPAGSFQDAKNPVPLPMIVHGKGMIPPGRVSDAGWTVVDVAPTVLDIARVKPANAPAGRSILPVLQGKRIPGNP